MGRIARVVVAGMAHHVTQRGNRRQQTFFCDDDYRAYLQEMSQWCGKCGVEIWAYCLMPNHIHMVAVPTSEDGLCRGIGEAHRRYTRLVNFRERWRGHLWQGRFASVVMDERHLWRAVRYIERNPLRARLVERAEDWPWSSAAAHIAGRDDQLVRVQPLLKLTAQWPHTWQQWLAIDEDAAVAPVLRRHEATGRPMGDESFVKKLERLLGRKLMPGKRGRPRMDAKRAKKANK